MHNNSWITLLQVVATASCPNSTATPLNPLAAVHMLEWYSALLLLYSRAWRGIQSGVIYIRTYVPVAKRDFKKRKK